jgi:predicted Zn-dependent peptidase
MEKQVILEEQRQDFNEPEFYVDTAFLKLLIEEHPYHNPIIGYKETISAANKTGISEFYSTYYVPNNMNILIIGDIDTKSVVENIKQTFSQLEPKPVPKADFPKVKLPSAPKYESSERDIGFVYLALGYIGPQFESPDSYTMHVLSTIFSTGESSRLQKIIKTQKKLIVRGTSVYWPLRDLGIFKVTAIIEPTKRDEAVLTLINELNKFKTEPVSKDELSRAKKLIRAEYAQIQELIEDQGMDIGHWWATGNLDEYDNYLEHIDKVTIQNIVDAARKYFTAYTLFELKPS